MKSDYLVLSLFNFTQALSKAHIQFKYLVGKSVMLGLNYGVRF